jgi:hypothetical protein
MSPDDPPTPALSSVGACPEALKRLRCIAIPAWLTKFDSGPQGTLACQSLVRSGLDAVTSSDPTVTLEEPIVLLGYRYNMYTPAFIDWFGRLQPVFNPAHRKPTSKRDLLVRPTSAHMLAQIELITPTVHPTTHPKCGVVQFNRVIKIRP